MSDARFSPDLLSATQDNAYYALTMFPYPSGIGLHCGHASIFTINDVVARFQRMQGKIVFNPFGFDAFGLPTENYAMERGIPAYEVTQENKAFFIKQVQALEISFDYEKVIDTSDPVYYQRTQWIFAELFKAGLVYRDTLRVNRCPSCQTVLANDQVVEGTCERCKTPIIQKKHPQWFIKITAYADKLLADLDLIDRPEETKIAQRNWIGRSEGAEIDFVIEGHDDHKITVFTTRPDTLYGVTALVVAPEVTSLDEYVPADHLDALHAYRKTTLAKTAVQRQQGLEEKSGVFSGIYALHPLTGERVPVWFADYVLPDYATGAVMFVPAHDERDRAFAMKYEMQVIKVIDQENADETSPLFSGEGAYTGVGKLINSGEFSGLDNQEAKKKIIAHLEAQGFGRAKVSYKLRDWSVSRQRYRGSPVPIYYDEQDVPHLIPDAELPVLLPLDLENYKPSGKSPLEDHPTFPEYHKDGKVYRRECDTLDTFMCSSFYFLRFLDPTNPDQLVRKEVADAWLPIELYTGGKEHTVGHLLYARFIHKFLYDQGYLSCPEPFQKLVHQGMVLGFDGRKMGKRYNNGIDPIEMVELYGADALRTYLMFMGPVDQDKTRNDNALHGVKKFLERIERILQQPWFGQQKQAVTSAVHLTIQGITDDFHALKLNTVVSKLMILTNTIYDQQAATNEDMCIMTRLLAPLAPSLADRLWEALGQSGDVHYAPRPVADPAKIIIEQINLPVQINGKMRGTLSVAPGLGEQEVLDLLHAHEHFAGYLVDKTIQKSIFVPDKIINIIVN